MGKSYFLRGALCTVFALSFSSVSLLAQDPDRTGNDADRAIASIEVQLGNATTAQRRYALLSHLPAAALAAGDLGKAEASAKELLKVGEEIDIASQNDGSNLSRTTHIGNTILGLVELKRRNITSAKRHLLASVRFAGRAHPVQMSFGPSMALAKALADRGEHEVVIEYLGLCAKFWKKEDGHLEKWIQVLKDGGTPDFGSNTRYVVDEW
jgi:hypothetical protein